MLLYWRLFTRLLCQPGNSDQKPAVVLGMKSLSERSVKYHATAALDATKQTSIKATETRTCNNKSSTPAGKSAAVGVLEVIQTKAEVLKAARQEGQLRRMIAHGNSGANLLVLHETDSAVQSVPLKLREGLHLGAQMLTLLMHVYVRRCAKAPQKKTNFL